MAPNSLHFVLLADIGEIIGILVGFGALILWVIQKVAEANKAMQPRQPRAVPPPVQAGAPGVARPAGQQADPLRNQVEEFLRRAGQGKQQPNQGAAPARRAAPAAREIELLLDEESLQPERRPVGAPLRPMEPRPAAAVPPSDKRPARRPAAPRKRVTLAERATQRAAARTQSIAQQASSLGKRIVEDDEQFDVQLKAKFDHKVGTLAGSTVSETELVPIKPDTPAAQIAAMLANPDGVRQAMVLNEILNRPSDRW